MKSSTARQILKIYQWVGIGLLVAACLGFAAFIVVMFFKDWKIMTCVTGSIAMLIGAAWLWIEADIDKNNPD
jgi:FtsH-binding integral membrane protein